MFYTNFVKLCNRKGIAPTAAAVEMGFHRSDATRWSKGAEPRRTTLEKVADYFGVSVDYLLNGERENPASVADGVDDLDVEALDIMHQLPSEKRAAALAMLRGLLSN